MARPDVAGAEVRGRVSRIQRACTGDGPGIRTTVFLQGCSLHCPWCHNPDYRPMGPGVARHSACCIPCGRCVPRQVCHGGCWRGKPACDGCGSCVAECPSAALVLLGAERDVGQVLRLVRRDMDYYHDTGGGLTLSGGEPLEQMQFVLALLEAARAEGIATAVETACALPPSAFAPVVGKADLYLCDVKTSRAAYRELVGADADVVRSNIEFLGRAGCRIVLRVPCVVGANFDAGLAAFVAELAALPGVEGVDLLPFHDWGRGKAVAAGLEEPDWATMRAPSGAELDGFRRVCCPRPVDAPPAATR